MIIPAVSRQQPPNLRLTHTLSHMLAQEGEMPDAYFFLHEECRMSIMHLISRYVFMKYNAVNFTLFQSTLVAKMSRIAFKLAHKSRAIRPSTNATGKYGRGETSTAYVSRMAFPPGGEQPGSGCIRHTP